MWDETAGFWRTRDAWEAATTAAQRAAAPALKRRPPTLDGQRRKWTLNASRYLASRPKVLAQSQGIAIRPPDTSGAAYALLEGLPAALAEEFDRRLASVAYAAFRSWPVSSGYSKASLFLVFDPDGASFLARIGDSAPYASLIRNNPARRLLGVPAKVAAEAGIAAALEALRG